MQEKQMLGDFIYTLRKEKGLSQAELGDCVGVSNKAVSKWETGEANPDLSVIVRLSEVLGVSADELLKCERIEKTEAESDAAPASGKFGVILQIPARLEYVSKKKTKSGLPYVHINFASFKPAKGIVAIGFNARGVLSVGLFCVGVVSCGVLSVGILAFGAIALGLLAGAGIALGGIAAGGLAAGIVAVGGAAFGLFAVGGLAAGYWAVTGEGGYAIGKHVTILANAVFRNNYKFL